jgi:hypothetical protein
MYNNDITICIQLQVKFDNLHDKLSHFIINIPRVLDKNVSIE